MTNNASIVVEDLSKTFTVYAKRGRLTRTRTRVAAVDHITFEIAPGEMVGYVGPNGAGKSTTIKMLTGILTPSGGTVQVGRFVPSRDRVELARTIGVVFGQRTQLWWDLPLADSFDLHRHLYRVDAAVHAERLRELSELLALDAFVGTPVRQLSLGQRMRAELTFALLHAPSVLFLDEPTIGLDVVSKVAVREFLATMNERHGTTVILTTHDLDDIERLCSRLLIIDHGHVIYDGGLNDLRHRYEPYRTLVVDLAMSLEPLEIDGAEVVRCDGPRQWLRFHRDQVAAADLIARVVALADVRDLTIEEPDIESVVARIYTDGRVDPPSG
jgi:ABC-2 type transport system ATP-binding protein